MRCCSVWRLAGWLVPLYDHDSSNTGKSDFNHALLQCPHKCRRCRNKSRRLYVCQILSVMSKPVLVFGSARSGTSWLSELMAKPRGYKLLFEPEHEDHVPQGHLLADVWMRQSEDMGQARPFIKRLLANRVDNDWIAQNSYRKFKMHLWPFLVRQIVVKFVRCNLSMALLAEEFNVRAVYLRRNPYDTIFSQNRVRFPWLFNLNKFATNDLLFEEILRRYGIDIRKESFTNWETLALRWCIENVFVEDYFGFRISGKISFVQYEKLRGNAEACSELFRDLGLKIPDNFEKLIGRPSSKTHPRSVIRKNSSNHQSDAAIGLSQEARKEINGILHRFGRHELVVE